MKSLHLSSLIFVLLISGLGLPIKVSGRAAERIGGNTSRYFASIATPVFGCRVSTQGGNLNVRNNAGYVIARLANGTPVRIVSDRGSRFMIAAFEGRRAIRGWVSSEFVTCS